MQRRRESRPLTSPGAGVSFPGMFTIIGGDGREYGPATADQIRAWIAAGRANLETKAKAAGGAEWRPLGEYPEFGGPALPPVLGAEPGVEAASAPVASEPADRGTRLAAAFIDNVVAFIACLPGFLALGASVLRAVLSGQAGAVEQLPAGQVMLGVGLLVVAGLGLLVVQGWMLITRGQTIGKRLLNIRIVRFADHANPGFVRVVLLRAVVPALLGAVPGVGVLFTLVDIGFIFRDDRRCLHDLLAETKVVKV